MSRKKRRQEVLTVGAVVLLILVMIYSGLQILESTVFASLDVIPEAVPSKTIVRDGVEYFPKQDITVVMVLGIDNPGPMTGTEYHKNSGLADVVMLVILDDAVKEYSVLQLNRDTMLEMTALGIRGEKAGTYYGQLALAHTYGSGLEDSSLNVKDTLMSLIHGLTVDHYVTMSLDAIPILNDAVGGVRVTVEDDFSAIDPEIKIGEMVLHGQQALTFVQTRKDVGSQMNVSRMDRQKEYMRGFEEALSTAIEDNGTFVLDTYDAVSPYIVSDCTVNTLSLLVDRFSEYELGEVITPEGENVRGEEYMEFYLDEEKFEELTLRLFYAPK